MRLLAEVELLRAWVVSVSVALTSWTGRAYVELDSVSLHVLA